MRTHLQRPDTDFPTSACNNGLDPAWITKRPADVTCGHCLRHIPRPTVRTFQGETGEDSADSYDERFVPYVHRPDVVGFLPVGPGGPTITLIPVCPAPTPTEPDR